MYEFTRHRVCPYCIDFMYILYEPRVCILIELDNDASIRQLAKLDYGLVTTVLTLVAQTYMYILSITLLMEFQSFLLRLRV